MLSINTNLSSLIAQNSMSKATDRLNLAIERMTSGAKLNHAKDNAANYSISTNLTTKIGAYMVAEDNCAMGLDMLTTANGSLNQISDKLQRLRDLAEQASNGTYGEQSLKAINTEANALVDEVERIYNNTEYNGLHLIKGRVIGTEDSRFIKEIDRRDTSKMKKLSSIVPTEKLEFGTYSISTPEELAQLATMTNNGLIGANTEFVLANDIDLSGYSNWTTIGKEYKDANGVYYGNLFKSTFDGNGFEISHLKINTSENIRSLFGTISGGTIKNVAVVDADVTGKDHTAGLVASLVVGSTMSNCFVTGSVVGESRVGGLIANCGNSTVEDCYADTIVTGRELVGGLVAEAAKIIIRNSYSKGEISVLTNSRIGGLIASIGNGASIIEKCFSGANINNSTWASGTFIGYLYDSTLSLRIIDCYSTGSVTTNNTRPFIGYKDVSSADVLQNTAALSDTDLIPFEILNNANIIFRDSNFSLQVSVNSSSNSSILIDTGLYINGISSLRNLGNNNVDYITYIDKFLSNILEKSTELGAVENRLTSALDEISVQQENLISSLSTIRDADIADESSEYIRQQILQQAASTLLATANQTPSIALQLI